jgi:serine/threonine-protein kinase HipA
MDRLIALLDGREVGQLHQDRTGRASFSYDESWRRDPHSYPLSLSMLLAGTDYGPRVVEPFLWGLLPDNEQILSRWAARYQVSARNAFRLIAHVGEDCAGAVQFVRPERIEAIQSWAEDKITWLNEEKIADRLRALREDAAAWRLPRDTGQFSLAGAQPKTALIKSGKRWGVPTGRIPTTHILKPPTGAFDGYAENEHFCQMLARALGLPAALSQVMHFRDEVAIVLERFDREQVGKEVRRVHQEDMCQALAVMPSRKYQNEGGPGVRDIVDLIESHSSDRKTDVETFLRAVIFNWLIAGTDAHAKNYAILISGDNRRRLAPLYDLSSTLPYKEFDPKRLKLSMKIGDEYELQAIGPRQWQKQARAVRLSPEKITTWVREMAEQTPDAARDVEATIKDQGLKHPIIKRLTQAVAERAKTILRAF